MNYTFQLQNILKWFSRAWVLYLLLVVAAIAAIDEKTAYRNHLNYLKDVEDYLRGIENKTKPIDELRLKDGLHYYRELKMGIPKNPYLFSNLGFCYFYLGDLRAAVGYYTKAIELEPAFYAFYYDLGVIFFKIADWEKSATYFKKALSLMPQAENYYVQTAKSFLKEGKKQASYYHLKLVRRVKEDQEELLTYLNFCLQNLKEKTVQQQEGEPTPSIVHFPKIENKNHRLHFHNIMDQLLSRVQWKPHASPWSSLPAAV